MNPFSGLPRFGVIYADPPWDYNDKGHTRRIDRQYETMTLDEICELPVQSLAATNCACFLWVTVPNLPWGLRVLKRWNFTYKSCAVWDKEIFGMGHYWRIQHEILLFGRIGKGTSAVHNLRSVIREKRTKHSVKPQTAYEHIEAMYPERKKIELFARAHRKGWSVWGDEI